MLCPALSCWLASWVARWTGLLPGGIAGSLTRLLACGCANYRALLVPAHENHWLKLKGYYSMMTSRLAPRAPRQAPRAPRQVRGTAPRAPRVPMVNLRVQLNVMQPTWIVSAGRRPAWQLGGHTNEPGSVCHPLACCPALACCAIGRWFGLWLLLCTVPSYVSLPWHPGFCCGSILVGVQPFLLSPFPVPIPWLIQKDKGKNIISNSVIFQLLKANK